MYSPLHEYNQQEAESSDRGRKRRNDAACSWPCGSPVVYDTKHSRLEVEPSAEEATTATKNKKEQGWYPSANQHKLRVWLPNAHRLFVSGLVFGVLFLILTTNVKSNQSLNLQLETGNT